MTETEKLEYSKSLLRELYSIYTGEMSPFAKEEHKNILEEIESFLQESDLN